MSATVVSTWAFGTAANRIAWQVMSQGGTALDAVEAGIRAIEADESNASVGLGGRPNADGVVQLDACVMDHEYRAGSVAALEGIAHPISVARRVMEQTRHVMLVGTGARSFALEQGFESVELLTAASRRAWDDWRRDQAAAAAGHDTITVLALGPEGELAGGCSTSGMGYKLPGRVGDSPIIGSGLYVDGAVGAAGATGVGEDVMRHCASLLVVEAMAAGLGPQQACEQTLRRIVGRDPGGVTINFHLIALGLDGRWGAAGTVPGFQCAVIDGDGPGLHDGAVAPGRGS